MRKLTVVVTSLAALLLVPSLASAVLLAPTSYAMPNGGGQASGGSNNYWDLSFTGTGSKTTDGAALSGGLGDLTDGVTSTDNWFVVENTAGTGPYVGWANITPAITFSFASAAQFTTVSVHVDDSNGNGGVSLPSSIGVTIGANTYTTTLTDDVASAPIWVDIAIPSDAALADTVVVTLNRSNTWVFADEVQFNVVPEPAAMTLALPIAAMLRRRRASNV